jgi:hypothetical protein
MKAFASAKVGKPSICYPFSNFFVTFFGSASEFGFAGEARKQEQQQQQGLMACQMQQQQQLKLRLM